MGDARTKSFYFQFKLGSNPGIHEHISSTLEGRTLILRRVGFLYFYRQLWGNFHTDSYNIVMTLRQTPDNHLVIGQLHDSRL